MLQRQHAASSAERPVSSAPTSAGGAAREGYDAAVGPEDATASRLEDLLEAAPIAIAWFDERLALVRANARFHELAGRSPGRVGFDTLYGLFPEWPVDRSAYGEAFFAGGEGCEPHPVRFAIRFGMPGAAEDSRDLRVIEATLTPVPARDGAPRGICFVGRDVSPVKPRAAGLARAGALTPPRSSGPVAAARQAAGAAPEPPHVEDARTRERRLAAVGQLAAGVMHDVNNALNPILAAAHLLLIHAEDPAAVRDYAARIARAAETGVATAARVGRFIRQEPEHGTHEELIDLSVVADEVIAMTAPLWVERTQGAVITLRRTVVDCALTRGTTCEVREALINIVHNALDAMACCGGGTLGVATRVDGTEAVVEVSDSGPGMSREVSDRAFEPFFTTKGARGTGLGLSEVYGIMRRHRGRAEIVSAPGAGTTVRLVFPLATALTPSGEVNAFLDRVPKRVLVVDGDVASRDLVRALLVADGHVVDVAASVAEARAWLEATAARFGRYDLLLVAGVLADGSAAAITTVAREWWPDLRVGLLGAGAPTPATPASAGEGNGDAAAHRCDFTVAKPISRDQLLALAGADD